MKAFRRTASASLVVPGQALHAQFWRSAACARASQSGRSPLVGVAAPTAACELGAAALSWLRVRAARKWRHPASARPDGKRNGSRSPAGRRAKSLRRQTAQTPKKMLGARRPNRHARLPRPPPGPNHRGAA